jgi:hypothetical protein
MMSRSVSTALVTLVLLLPCYFPAHAGQEEGAGTASPHDYTVAIRPSVWFVSVKGKIADKGPRGNPVRVKIDDDLGFEDPFASFLGEGNLRLGGHDIWITGTSVHQSETVGIDVSFEIDGTEFEVGADVKSSIDLTDINLRYG